jgi:hypothetical protein
MHGLANLCEKDTLFAKALVYTVEKHGVSQLEEVYLDEDGNDLPEPLLYENLYRRLLTVAQWDEQQTFVVHVLSLLQDTPALLQSSLYEVAFLPADAFIIPRSTVLTLLSFGTSPLLAFQGASLLRCMTAMGILGDVRVKQGKLPRESPRALVYMAAGLRRYLLREISLNYSVETMHSFVLSSYRKSSKHWKWSMLTDDGYIMSALLHHMTLAKKYPEKEEELLELLNSVEWWQNLMSDSRAAPHRILSNLQTLQAYANVAPLRGLIIQLQEYLLQESNMSISSCVTMMLLHLAPVTSADNEAEEPENTTPLYHDTEPAPAPAPTKEDDASMLTRLFPQLAALAMPSSSPSPSSSPAPTPQSPQSPLMALLARRRQTGSQTLTLAPPVDGWSESVAQAVVRQLMEAWRQSILPALYPSHAPKLLPLAPSLQSAWPQLSETLSVALSGPSPQGGMRALSVHAHSCALWELEGCERHGNLPAAHFVGTFKGQGTGEVRGCLSPTGDIAVLALKQVQVVRIGNHGSFQVEAVLPMPSWVTFLQFMEVEWSEEGLRPMTDPSTSTSAYADVPVFRVLWVGCDDGSLHCVVEDLQSSPTWTCMSTHPFAKSQWLQELLQENSEMEPETTTETETDRNGESGNDGCIEEATTQIPPTLGAIQSLLLCSRTQGIESVNGSVKSPTAQAKEPEVDALSEDGWSESVANSSVSPLKEEQSPAVAPATENDASPPAQLTMEAMETHNLPPASEAESAEGSGPLVREDSSSSNLSKQEQRNAQKKWKNLMELQKKEKKRLEKEAKEAEKQRRKEEKQKEKEKRKEAEKQNQRQQLEQNESLVIDEEQAPKQRIQLRFLAQHSGGMVSCWGWEPVEHVANPHMVRRFQLRRFGVFKSPSQVWLDDSSQVTAWESWMTLFSEALAAEEPWTAECEGNLLAIWKKGDPFEPACTVRVSSQLSCIHVERASSIIATGDENGRVHFFKYFP